jgi:DNA polymerase I-like protein with 3'-5' exonuclease and polymerase domains
MWLKCAQGYPAPPERPQTSKENSMALQLPLLAPVSDWRPPSIADLPVDWNVAGKVCIDAETRDPFLKKLGISARRGGYTTGWSFTLENGPSFYLPIRHEGGDNMDMNEVFRYLRHQAKNFKGELVGANLQYDLDYASNDGIEFPLVKFFRDVQIADPLINELHMSYSLAAIGERWGVMGKDESELVNAAKSYGVDPKAGMWQLPARFVGRYAANDTKSPLEILKKQQVFIDRWGLQDIFDLESEVLPVLVKMRRRGILIDQDKLAQIEEWTVSEQNKALSLIRHETGFTLSRDNVNKANALAPILENIGMDIGKTSQGRPNIENAKMEAFKHPVADAIRFARKMDRMRNTFAASIRRYMTDGRIHSTFNQIAREDEAGEQKGVRYGRLSATHPNLQQQPSPNRDPVVAGEWRKIYIPEEGAILGALDYKQQEPRWTTHISALMGLEKAAATAKAYRDDPTTDNHDMMTALIHGPDVKERLPYNEYKVLRGQCKNIYLGLCYGEGGAKLSRELGLPTRWAVAMGRGGNRKVTYYDHQWQANNAMGAEQGFLWEAAGEEGQAIIDKFDAEVPFVRQCANAASKQANKNGFVKTLLGRRLHFPQDRGGRFEWTHKALNRVIQGNGADQVKRATVDLNNAGYFLQLQVHDELVGSFGSVAEATDASKLMVNAVPGLLVPFAVDVDCGPNWGEC